MESILNKLINLSIAVAIIIFLISIISVCITMKKIKNLDSIEEKSKKDL